MEVRRKEVKGTATYQIGTHTFRLLPQKAAFLVEQKALLLADLHLGKINHFRKSGIPLPPSANDHNTGKIIDLIQHVKPHRVIFLGDLFHSHYNEEWPVLGQIINHFASCSFELVRGNHDIMSDYQYERFGIKVVDELLLDSLLFSHHPLESVPDGLYNIAGHIHPGARLHGRGRQAITLPCFYFGEKQGLLPAFGSFTGLARITVSKNDRIFVVANDEIIAVHDN